MQAIPPVYVVDFMTGRKVHRFIPDPAHPGKYLCNYGDCRRPTGHHNYAVCWEHTSEVSASIAWKRSSATCLTVSL